MNTISEFYDALAPEYDRMIDLKLRFEKEKPLFREFIQQFSIHRALDAGCGTGFHSLLLASLGVQVTAVDLSNEMLIRLQNHATEMHLHIQTYQTGFDNLSSVVHEKLDAVLCLGNTLPHLLTKESALQALRNFHSLLNDNGVLVIQCLNYDRIMKKRERIQNVKEREGKTYVRFYDFLGETIAFNILTLGLENGKSSYSLQTTELRPLMSADLVRLIQNAGFTDIHQYGTLSQSPFDIDSSPDLVFIARKNHSSNSTR